MSVTRTALIGWISISKTDTTQQRAIGGARSKSCWALRCRCNIGLACNFKTFNQPRVFHTFIDTFKYNRVGKYFEEKNGREIGGAYDIVAIACIRRVFLTVMNSYPNFTTSDAHNPQWTGKS